MAYCPSCGTEVADNARFCGQCGAAIQAKAEAPGGQPVPASLAPASQAAPIDNQPADPANRAEPLWTGWPCRKRHLPMLLLALVVLIAPGIATAITKILPLLIASGVGLLACLWIAGKMVIEPIALRYWVTIDRLFIRRGILSRTTDQMELIRVDDIRMTQGIVERMLGIGNVEVVATTDRTEGDITLFGIAEPAKVAELIRENMRKLRQKRGMFVENV
jgi:membrane protein YdbS with pleckstrin-like domain